LLHLLTTAGTKRTFVDVRVTLAAAYAAAIGTIMGAFFLLGRIAIGDSLQAFGLKGAHFNRKKLVVDSH
jgi:hypothetical protein